MANRSAPGQSLVEMALTLPLLLILSLGAIDVGRALTAYLGLVDAAHEGALYAAWQPSGDVEGRVRGASEAEWVSGATVTVFCTTSPDPGTITVTASYNLGIMTPLVHDMFGDSLPLSATSVATNLAGGC